MFTDQNEFAEEKIDLTKARIDPNILEKLVKSLWRENRKLELGIKNAMQLSPSTEKDQACRFI